MYTCRQIAAEMHGLAFRQHTITFTTIYSEQLRTRAGRWHFLLTDGFATGMLSRSATVTDEAIQGMKDNMAEEAARQLVDSPFLGIFSGVRAGQLAFSLRAALRHWGEASSVHRETIRRILNLAITDPDLHEYFATKHWQSSEEHGGAQKARYEPALLFNLDKEPWRIPTEEELDHLAAEMPYYIDPPNPRYPPDRYPPSTLLGTRQFWKSNWQKYRFSAAAAAAAFLGSGVSRPRARALLQGESRPSH
jgi:hypothetical protein